MLCENGHQQILTDYHFICNEYSLKCTYNIQSHLCARVSVCACTWMLGEWYFCNNIFRWMRKYLYWTRIETRQRRHAPTCTGSSVHTHFHTSVQPFHGGTRLFTCVFVCASSIHALCCLPVFRFIQLWRSQNACAHFSVTFRSHSLLIANYWYDDRHIEHSPISCFLLLSHARYKTHTQMSASKLPYRPTRSHISSDAKFRTTSVDT